MPTIDTLQPTVEQVQAAIRQFATHVDVMITNGGYGGVQFALSHGVPLVVAGATEEKPEIAARVAWSGAGINLKTHQPTAAQIGVAVREVLANPRYRQNARRIQADYARHNAPEAAAELLEQLAATGRQCCASDRRPKPLGVDGDWAGGA